MPALCPQALRAEEKLKKKKLKAEEAAGVLFAACHLIMLLLW